MAWARFPSPLISFAISHVLTTQAKISDWKLSVIDIHNRDTLDKSYPYGNKFFETISKKFREGPFFNKSKGTRKGTMVRKTTRKVSSTLSEPVIGSPPKSIPFYLPRSFPTSVLWTVLLTFSIVFLSSSLFMQATTCTRIQFRSGTWQAIRPTRIESEVTPSCSLRLPTFSFLPLLYFVYREIRDNVVDSMFISKGADISFLWGEINA